MNEQKDRYGEIVRRTIAKAGAGDRAARLEVYQRLRASNEQVIARSPSGAEMGRELRLHLEEAIDEHEASFAPAVPPPESLPNPDPPPFPLEPGGVRGYSGRGRTSVAALTTMLLLGFLLGVGAIYALPLVIARGEDVSLRASLSQARPALDETVALLDRARAQIEAMQKADPAGLARKAGAKFVRLIEVFPAFGKEEATLASRARLVVRADADRYKLLAQTSLCSAARFLRPELVDPKRDNMPFGCSSLGYWNEAGKNL